MRVIDLGVMPYRQAWEFQEKTHQEVVAGSDETLLLVEHPPVITLGRRGVTAGNLLRSETELRDLNIELVHSDRGGDVTFHGPGQMVAYPIVRLLDHKLSVGGFVHRLESIVIAALDEIGISAATDPNAVGVWIHLDTAPEKICAIGVRIRRGVSLHGLALNVTGKLEGFNHIVPCGLPSRGVTSIQKILGERVPSLESVKATLIRHITHSFSQSF
jgi:lipoyl(octanoyl) transferase